MDETRFELDPAMVIGGYERRDEDVPGEWLDRVQVVNPWANGWHAVEEAEDRWSGGQGSSLADRGGLDR